MATIADGIAEYAHSLGQQDVPFEVADYAKRLFLDSLACIYGGLTSKPSNLIAEALQEIGGKPQATVIATGEKVPAQHAALINGAALRFPDFNDIYYGPAWAAHCSDSTAALMAVAEWHHRSGLELLLALITTYEVQLRFSDLPVEKNLWHRGWQLSVAVACAAAAGISKLMRLETKQTAYAIALAGARTNTFSEIRRGEINMHKAFSEPIAASHSVFYSLLASKGFTACLNIFEGDYGFRNAVAGGVDVGSLVPNTDEFKILKVAIKPYPVQGMTPAMVQAALELRAQHNIAPGDVVAIKIIAPEEAITKPSWDVTKLKPDTKETADHSFHYCVAVALAAGEVTIRQFEEQWLRNPIVHSLIDKTSLSARNDLTQLYKRGARPAAVEIRTAKGTFYREVQYPIGDPNHPMDWANVREKFMGQIKGILSEARAQTIIDWVVNMEMQSDVADLVANLTLKRAETHD